MAHTSSRKASRGTSPSGEGATEQALSPDVLRSKRETLAQQHDKLMTEIARANEQIMALRGAISLLDQLVKDAEARVDAK